MTWFGRRETKKTGALKVSPEFRLIKTLKDELLTKVYLSTSADGIIANLGNPAQALLSTKDRRIKRRKHSHEPELLMELI